MVKNIKMRHCNSVWTWCRLFKHCAFHITDDHYIIQGDSLMTPLEIIEATKRLNILLQYLYLI